MKKPRSAAVAKTPKLAKSVPRKRTRFADFHSESYPPENKMNANANEPIKFDVSKSSNSTPSKPSVPASIPTAKKTRSVGARKIVEILLAKIPAKRKKPATKKTCVVAKRRLPPQRLLSAVV